jgi:hypothetical protein
MDRDLLALLVWCGSAALAIPTLWLKQRRYLGDQQIGVCLFAGPIALALAILCPRSWFTTREQAEGHK